MAQSQAVRGLSSLSHILSRHDGLRAPALFPSTWLPSQNTHLRGQTQGPRLRAATWVQVDRCCCRRVPSSKGHVESFPARSALQTCCHDGAACISSHTALPGFPTASIHKHRAPSTGMPLHSLQAPRPRLSDLSLATALRGQHPDLILWRRKQLREASDSPKVPQLRMTITVINATAY